MFAPEPCCEIPDGCCHDESITVKLELNYFVPLFAFDFTQLAIDLPATIELIQVKYPVYSSFVTTINTPPPSKDTNGSFPLADVLIMIFNSI